MLKQTLINLGVLCTRPVLAPCPKCGRTPFQHAADRRPTISRFNRRVRCSDPDCQCGRRWTLYRVWPQSERVDWIASAPRVLLASLVAGVLAAASYGAIIFGLGVF